VVNAAFFDLDKTVIAKASIVAFGRPLRREGLITRRTMIKAAAQQLIFLQFGADEDRLDKAREATLEVTRGWSRSQVRAIVRETLLEIVEPLIYAEALELIEHHRAAGDRVYLVSAAPEEIVIPLAEMLGVDGALASRAQVDRNDCYTGQMAFYCYGPNKAVAIEELAGRSGISLEGSSAYSDSATDAPMLEAVGHGFAVNPDRALAKLAEEHGWEVLSFTKPVRLRDRVSTRTPIAAGALALLGAGAYAVARLVRRAARAA
jgi:HAD superfamily hydrolase (TIGR01490 family)